MKNIAYNRYLKELRRRMVDGGMARRSRKSFRPRSHTGDPFLPCVCVVKKRYRDNFYSITTDEKKFYFFTSRSIDTWSNADVNIIFEVLKDYYPIKITTHSRIEKSGFQPGCICFVNLK
jgi:hypothetical protein